MYVLHTFIHMHVHVHTRSCWNVFACTRYRHVCTMSVCTVLPNPVQVVRIPGVPQATWLGSLSKMPLAQHDSDAALSAKWNVPTFEIDSLHRKCSSRLYTGTRLGRPTLVSVPTSEALNFNLNSESRQWRPFATVVPFLKLPNPIIAKRTQESSAPRAGPPTLQTQ